MGFDLPSAAPKYSQTNENNARKALELALGDILSRLKAAEDAVANGGGAANPPTASFSSSVNNTDAVFTDTSRPGSAPIVTYAWNFGDGGASTLQNPTHTYAAAGTYTVTLTVEDGDGVTDDFTADVVISVPATGPTADFVFSATGLTVQFTGASTAGSAPITSRSWQFGDGQLGSTGAPSHTYGAAGTYSVTFTVADSNGLSDSITKSVTVAAVVSGNAKLYVGPFEAPEGTGPDAADNPNSPNPWTLLLGIHTSVADIRSQIAKARATGGFYVLNFTDNRHDWLPGGTFDFDLYKAKIDRFVGIPEIQQAVDDKIIGAYVGDEFNLFTTYSGTVSPRDMNDMGLYFKSKWPGILTFMRISAITFKEGWSNTDGVSAASIINGTGYTGIDYCISQYARSAFNKGLNVAGWYAQEKSIAATPGIDIGVIPSLNWLDGPPPTLDSIPLCWDYNDDGISSGIIVGTTGVGVPDGTRLNCGDSRVADQTKMVCPPALVRKFFDVVTADPAFPGAGFWSYPGHGFSWYDELQMLYYRPDFTTEFKRGLTNGNARTNGNGWRSPK